MYSRLLTFSRLLLVLCLFSALYIHLPAQSLSTGDIVVVGFNGDADPDEIALLALTEISTSETFYLTDYPVTSTGGFTLDTSNSTNGSVSMTPTTAIPAGTIFTVSISSGSASVSVTGASVSTSITGWTSTSSSAPSGGAGDAWHIFLGTGSTTPTSFIYAFANTSAHNSVWDPLSSGSFTSTESYLGNGLLNGTNAIDIGGSNHNDNLYYTGSFASGTAAEILARVVNTSNYTGNNSTTYDITVDGASDFNTSGATTNPAFTISGGVVTAPEINVKQSTTDIALAGNHAFGSVQIGDFKDVVFTVENTGDADLDITSITPSGTGYSIQSAISADPISDGTSATFTVRFEPTATTQGAGSVTIANDDADEGSYVINFTGSATDATLDIKVFLEGPLITNTMSTNLQLDLPINPNTVYSGVTSETSSGIPGTAVDWVEVELRTGTLANTKVGTNRGGILLSTGAIVDKDGNAFIMSQVDGSDYYIVIHHRNHLSVMSNVSVSPSSGTYTFDFTASQANNYSGDGGTTNGAVQVGSVFAMIAGDTNDDGDINGTDLTNWRPQNGAVFSYGSNGITDFNLDGVINAVDRNDFYRKNTGISSQVPGS